MQEIFEDLYEKSGGQRFGLTLDDFAAILLEIRNRYLPSSASTAEATKFYGSLRLEDLALARACALGSEPAWNLFVNRYRQKLYAAARVIAKEECEARELADSLYANLFVARISKLASYTGRGSLEAWLRTVLAQEYVNRYRSRRLLVSFDEQTEPGYRFPNDSYAETRPDPRLEQATDAALLELSGEERMMLASYYLDERTFAEIARMLGTHESTVSRHLGRITARLRKRILQSLRKQGMSARAAEEAMEADVRDLKVDLRARLVQEKSE